MNLETARLFTRMSPSQDAVRWTHIYHLLTGVLVNDVPGDICEIGCNEGHTSVFIQTILNHRGSDARLHIYDSFEGMPEWSPQDAGSQPIVGPGQLRATQQQVMAKFTELGLRPPEVHVGWVEQTIPAELPEQIAFALIDVDLYGPIKHALEYVYPRMAPGGVIIIDDYAWCGTPGARTAVDEFLADKPEVLEHCHPAVSVFVRMGDVRRGRREAALQVSSEALAPSQL